MRILIHLLPLIVFSSLAAHSVEPKIVTGNESITGETTHPHVRCIAYEQSNGLISFEFILSGGLVEELVPFLNMRHEDRHLLTTAIGVFPKGRSETEVEFGFSFLPEFVNNSYVEIFTKNEFLRLPLETVKIRKRQQIDDGNAEKPPGVERKR